MKLLANWRQRRWEKRQSAIMDEALMAAERIRHRERLGRSMYLAAEYASTTSNYNLTFPSTTIGTF